MSRDSEQATAASRDGERKQRPPAAAPGARPDLSKKRPATVRNPAPAAKPRSEQRMDTDYDPDPRPPRKSGSR